MERGQQALLDLIDRQLLAALAEHRVMVSAQLALLLDVPEAESEQRLARLREQGFLQQERVFEAQPAATWITRHGLAAVERRLAVPRLDLKGYRHDVGVGWAWLAAREGAFGAVAEVISEREMRSHDRRADREREPYGVTVGRLDARGRPIRHYPDLMLMTPDGRRLAVELELTTKSRARLDAIMLAYAGDPSIEGVLYLVADRRLERLIGDAVNRAGIGDLVRVQRLAAGGITGAPEPDALAARRPLASGRAADLELSR
ncbi:MAG TPA: hypothetical protein VME01_09485 [Solirubrobacteraceae bacterium]|nr:hypothetical protein [Solirubrobacteraceae bacterium]